MIAICWILACMDSIIRITRQFPRVYVDYTWVIRKPGFCKWCQPENLARTAQKNPFFPRRIRNKFPFSSFPPTNVPPIDLRNQKPRCFSHQLQRLFIFWQMKLSEFSLFATTPRWKNNIPTALSFSESRGNVFPFFFFYGIPSPMFLCKQYRGGERIRKILSPQYQPSKRHQVRCSSIILPGNDSKICMKFAQPSLQCI